MSEATTILVLVENTVRRTDLIAEHGLSFLIQNRDGTVLFDTGQGAALLPNAERLKLDLSSVDRIVLSHGHHDHTGGLKAVLEHIGPREVLAHPDALQPKLAATRDEVRTIGMPDRASLERAGARFDLSDAPREVVPGVTATGTVPRNTDFEVVPDRFQRFDGDRRVHDEIWDDQALVVETGEGPVVVLGCAHAGLINTLDYVSELTGERRFAAVVGGTHLVEADEAAVRNTMEALQGFSIGRLAPCHCTGFAGQATMWQHFGESFAVTGTGDRLEWA